MAKESEAGLSVLRPDCENCFGLCCVAPAFAASADFAIDKPAGVACPNLQSDFSCGIHSRLRQTGFPGCAVFDCFGAGQKVAQVTFGGHDWREAPDIAQPMFDVFAVMRQLHELLWYLSEALTFPAASSLRAELTLASEEIEGFTLQTADDLLTLDMAGRRAHVGALLLRTSEAARADLPGPRVDHRGADLAGADLKGADLRAANLRGALLIAADLRRADLRGADLIGADLRGADIRGADLTGSVFLTQSQLDAAKGDVRTKLPSALAVPAHWLHAHRPVDPLSK